MFRIVNSDSEHFNECYSLVIVIICNETKSIKTSVCVYEATLTGDDIYNIMKSFAQDCVRYDKGALMRTQDLV